MAFLIERFSGSYSAAGRVRGTVTWVISPVVTPTVRVWLAIGRDGTFDINNLHLDSLSSGALPHLNTSSCCVRPQGLPQTIRTGSDLANVVLAMKRAFKTVNMTSLLVAPPGWMPCIREALPAECLAHYNGTLTADQITQGIKVPFEQQAAETWEVGA